MCLQLPQHRGPKNSPTSFFSARKDSSKATRFLRQFKYGAEIKRAEPQAVRLEEDRLGGQAQAALTLPQEEGGSEGRGVQAACENG